MLQRRFFFFFFFSPTSGTSSEAAVASKKIQSQWIKRWWNCSKWMHANVGAIEICFCRFNLLGFYLVALLRSFHRKTDRVRPLSAVSRARSRCISSQVTDKCATKKLFFFIPFEILQNSLQCIRRPVCVDKYLEKINIGPFGAINRRPDQISQENVIF